MQFAFTVTLRHSTQSPKGYPACVHCSGPILFCVCYSSKLFPLALVLAKTTTFLTDWSSSNPTLSIYQMSSVEGVSQSSLYFLTFLSLWHKVSPLHVQGKYKSLLYHWNTRLRLPKANSCLYTKLNQTYLVLRMLSENDSTPPQLWCGRLMTLTSHSEVRYDFKFLKSNTNTIILTTTNTTSKSSINLKILINN